ncbi:MAG: helix-turn-helix domain-containing protein [Gemmatimonadetes bacterium]|nr:helix-turn-helix domain-containing protein [Gemmatimonadota bacterium]NNK48764.1 helix-turn-helix domain-containing protein [Gemmatimonadota bacterium]
METKAAILLSEARERAGLTQRELARRASTAQSVVARIELGITDPGTGTLSRLLAAAGFELRARLEPALIVDTHMLNDVERILRLTPEERLREVANLSRFRIAARRV